MDKTQTPSAAADEWSRSAWVVFAILWTVILLLQLLRWTHGFDHWDNLLPSTALVIIALAHVFQLKGLAKRLSQVVSWALLIIMAIMLIRR
jgi:hypothetical protein